VIGGVVNHVEARGGQAYTRFPGGVEKGIPGKAGTAEDGFLVYEVDVPPDEGFYFFIEEIEIVGPLPEGPAEYRSVDKVIPRGGQGKINRRGGFRGFFLPGGFRRAGAGEKEGEDGKKEEETGRENPRRRGKPRKG
jgi:hypothetical protein